MNKKIIKNTSMLYMMNIAKMIFPLITLPYLTRVLSVECYGTVSYVKAVMQYVQMLVDFGFMLSGTKQIALLKNDKQKLNEAISSIFFARLILSIIAWIIVMICVLAIDILKTNVVFTMLSIVPVLLTVFLFDYVFRGLEKMEVITGRFVIMRGLSAILTFVFVKKDSDILWIPVLDIIGSLCAIALIVGQIRKEEIIICKVELSSVFAELRTSAIYFFSNIATTAFMALNTLLIGILLTQQQVAYWSVCLQMVTAVQSLYTPLTDGIYPQMMISKDIRIVKKSIKLYMPIVTIGCVFTTIVAPIAISIVGGKQYISASGVLRCLVPVLFFSFLSMIYGWPTLGAIGKQQEVTKSTIITALIQIVGLLLLAVCGCFDLIHIALLRSATEFLLFAIRFSYYKRFKADFNYA